MCPTRSELMRSLKFFITENSVHGKSPCCPSKKWQTIPLCEQLSVGTNFERIKRTLCSYEVSTKEIPLYHASSVHQTLSWDHLLHSFWESSLHPRARRESQDNTDSQDLLVPLLGGGGSLILQKFLAALPTALRKGPYPPLHGSISLVIRQKDTKTQWSAPQGLHP